MRVGIGAMVVAAVLVACGGEDGVARPPEGIATVHGVVDGNPARAPARPHVGLVYPALGGAELVSYYGDAAAVSKDFPASFEFELDHRPVNGAIGSYWNEDGTEDARMAMAFVMAFDDVDGDGTWKENAEGGIEPDLLLGISLDTLLVYIERAPVAGGAGEAVFENPGDATPGYHLARPICGDENNLGKLRILGLDEGIDVVVPESDDEIEMPCLDFPWPTSEAPF